MVDCDTGCFVHDYILLFSALGLHSLSPLACVSCRCTIGIWGLRIVFRPSFFPPTYTSYSPALVLHHFGSFFFFFFPSSSTSQGNIRSFLDFADGKFHQISRNYCPRSTSSKSYTEAHGNACTQSPLRASWRGRDALPIYCARQHVWCKRVL